MDVPAMQAGARGYLLKGADQEEVVRTIVTVAHGGAVFGPALAARITQLLSAGKAAAPAAFPQLTERERQVLDLAGGRSNAQIAETLFLSPKTVRNVVSTIFAKIQGRRPRAGDRHRPRGRARP